MFLNLIKVKQDKKGLLVDSKCNKYLHKPPIKTINIKFYGKPFLSEGILSAKKYTDLMKKLQFLRPQPKAWLDVGVLKEGIEIMRIPDMDLNGEVYIENKEVLYRIHKLEFYHID